MSSFDKKENGSLTDSIVQMLQRKIISGELKAGDWLQPEREMADDLGISRGSLHQAIVSLANQGFVSIVPRKGTVVCDYRKDPTPQSLAVVMNYGSVNLEQNLFSDMMDFRMWMECECARLACKNINDSILFEMRSIAAGITDRKTDQVDLIYRFHYLLTLASGNSIFSMIFRGFEPAVRSLTRHSYDKMGTDISQTAEQMKQLIRCIQKGDEAAAEAAVVSLLTPGIEHLRTRYM